ncbi:hypothetical protein [Rickettsia endosymbiont of Culicoides newsteadi]|uniref:hypothetical protein n=1 Tax=Rickettsia endosymbiont of Culicoides newsteadi TaxID=1961830 RepID=UPI000B9ABA37|nr:hypothetical protein [Rickettsia endosymbiont of Culicoides newsteadi]OZG31858.1 hypothetical protein RiCNE_07470 [Rickettsia endosymbiont of Culicoides newsteadi]
MIKQKDLNTAEEFQYLGEYYYRLAVDMEDKGEPQKKIDASWSTASINFWQALTLGSTKAPLSLFKCFGQGLGVNKNDDVATLMYGTALQFTPKDCANNIKDENKPVIAKSMQPRIDELVKLVKQTHKQVPSEGISMEKVLDQMDKFNHAIKLPSGKLIQSCFTEKNIQDTKAKELKSKALDLTKNLPNYNKTTIATKNHNSKKINSITSRNGFGIL